MACAGIWLIFSPIYSLLGWFPFVGKFLGAVGSFLCGLIGLILGSVTSLITIALSWISYRPCIAIFTLILCSGILVYVFYDYEH